MYVFEYMENCKDLFGKVLVAQAAIQILLFFTIQTSIKTENLELIKTTCNQLNYFPF